MKFKALVYKEIRECLPFAIGVVLVLIVIGSVAIHVIYSEAQTGKKLIDKSFLEGIIAWLTAFSIGLGVALGLRQYHSEFTAKVWSFLLHRSVSRSTILTSKLFTALLCFMPIMIIFGLFSLFLNDKYISLIPLTTGIIWKGLSIVSFGYVAYLAVALAALNKVKWYTTKMLSVLFFVWMFITFIVQQQLCWAWITVIAAVSILLVQITDVFLNREFE